MGYYCTAEIDFQIKWNMVDVFLAKVNLLRNEGDNPAHLFFELLHLEDRWITFADHCAEWSNTEAFARFLAHYAECGYLRFYGEDNERWGYYFDGDGKVYALEYLERIAAMPLRQDEPEPEARGKSRSRNGEEAVACGGAL
jgi:hypothetical protein